MLRRRYTPVQISWRGACLDDASPPVNGADRIRWVGVVQCKTAHGGGVACTDCAEMTVCCVCRAVCTRTRSAVRHSTARHSAARHSTARLSRRFFSIPHAQPHNPNLYNASFLDNIQHYHVRRPNPDLLSSCADGLEVPRPAPSATAVQSRSDPTGELDDKPQCENARLRNRGYPCVGHTDHLP